MTSLKIVVVGGGAAGFFGAIACAEAHPDAHVLLLEAGRQVLAKVRISGGGRCNVTHACFDPAELIRHYPRGEKALRGALTRFQPRDTINWFEGWGVRLKTEADGRIFPTTDDSETIVECLLAAAKASEVRIRTGASVISICRGEVSGFEIELNTGEQLHADRLLIATGSNPRGHHWAQELGHSIEPPVPSLFTFNIADAALQELAGVSVPLVRVQLPHAKLEQTGALLITHWGLSGPAVLKLSAWGARVLHECRYQTPLHVNWLPQMTAEEIRSQLQATRLEHAKKTIAAYCPFTLPKRLWHYLVDRCGIDKQKRWTELSNSAAKVLISTLDRCEYSITGKGVFKEEFVTCGGVNLKEINFKTMESRCCSHLYFAGEVLDIDGVTGGFNFQSAWTTGWIAGQAMGETALDSSLG